MSVANRPTNRPLSPHLQIYKWQLTSVLSILHRATGIALAVGTLLLLALLFVTARSPMHSAYFDGAAENARGSTPEPDRAGLLAS